MKTKNPSACRNRIEPYIQIVRRSSTGVIAWNDCPTIRRMLIRVCAVWPCAASALILCDGAGGEEGPCPSDGFGQRASSRVGSTWYYGQVGEGLPWAQSPRSM